MVAFSSLVALIPVVLLALFAVGLAVGSDSARAGLLGDLARIFPAAAQSTLSSSLDTLSSSTTALGLVGFAGAVWSGIGLWSAIDTAFRGIYGYEARGWVGQKRWAARMLLLSIALLLAVIGVPALHSILFDSRTALPFGLERLGTVSVLLASVLSHLVLFAGLCLLYVTVPPWTVPWRRIWPGAALATLMITIVSFSFPIYLANSGTFSHPGAVLGFFAVMLIWAYLMAMSLMLGAALNAGRPSRGPASFGR